MEIKKRYGSSSITSCLSNKRLQTENKSVSRMWHLLARSGLSEWSVLTHRGPVCCQKASRQVSPRLESTIWNYIFPTFHLSNPSLPSGIYASCSAALHSAEMGDSCRFLRLSPFEKTVSQEDDAPSKSWWNPPARHTLHRTASRIFLYWPTVKWVQIQEPLIKGTRQTNEDLSTPTTKGITHYAGRLGYLANHQCFLGPHAENP